MQIGKYLGLVYDGEKKLAESFKHVAKERAAEPDVYNDCKQLAKWSESHISKLEPFVRKYPLQKEEEADHLTQTLFSEPRKGSLALLRDLHDLWLLANETHLSWIVILQAAQALRDEDLQTLCLSASDDIQKQTTWLLTRIKQAAPQILVVAD